MERRRDVITEADRSPRTEPLTVCACTVPVPEVRALRKGAARTHCSTCGLPVRLDFAIR